MLLACVACVAHVRSASLGTKHAQCFMAVCESFALSQRMQTTLRVLSKHAARCAPFARGAVRCMATAEPIAGNKRKMGKTIGE